MSRLCGGERELIAGFPSEGSNNNLEPALDQQPQPQPQQRGDSSTAEG